MHILEIPISELLNGQTVESVRLEFKKTWNDAIAAAVAKTVSAFANDLQGRYGGYVILGVEEAGGKPVLPPHGLDTLDLDKVQKEIRVICKTHISPEWSPVISPETYDGRSLLVIWVPPEEERPYKARNGISDKAPFAYFVRIGSETIEVKEKDPHYDQLMQLTASVSFDQRKRYDVDLSVISGMLLRRALLDVKSELAADVTLDTPAILRRMSLSARTNGSEAPRNVALLFFTDLPEFYFPGAFIELAQFRDDGDLIENRAFRGPVQEQARSVIEYLDGLVGTIVRKVPGNVQAERFVAFPHDAMREAVVNAIYHRGYDGPPLPIKIGLYPDRMEITSYPGPVPGLQREHLAPGGNPPQLPARNPHIGDLLKRLRLAETWLTGIPKIRRRMKENGSPEPKFDFDDARTYFRVTLPAHPGYVVLHGLREAAALWHTGDRARALALANDLGHRLPESGAIAALRIDFAAEEGDLVLARQILSDLQKNTGATDTYRAMEAMARALVSTADPVLASEARSLLEKIASPQGTAEAVERAILHKRLRDPQKAHHIFSSMAAEIQHDPRALHEYAQAKIQIATSLRHHERAVKRRLSQEAVQILRRVVAISVDQPLRAAWAWFDMAKTLRWLGEPSTEVRSAIEQAKTLGGADPNLLHQIANFERRPSRG